jgi:translation initiation factor 2 beta subunit (eIF-2beta)/eIF-5
MDPYGRILAFLDQIENCKISKNVYGKIRAHFSTFVFRSLCLEIGTDSRFTDRTSFVVYTQHGAASPVTHFLKSLYFCRN